MRREQLEKARTALTHRREELVRLLRDGNAGIAQIRSEREIEFGDEAQSEEEQERIALVGEAESAELTRVDAALARVAAGTYGICAGCGEPIEPRRLAASPYAVQCADCAGAGAASAPARR
jgi:DnaK suppressor protein